MHILLGLGMEFFRHQFSEYYIPLNRWSDGNKNKIRQTSHTYRHNMSICHFGITHKMKLKAMKSEKTRLLSITRCTTIP